MIEEVEGICLDHLEGDAAALAQAGCHGVHGIPYHCDAALPKRLARLQPPAGQQHIRNCQSCILQCTA